MGACMNSKESKKNPVAAFFGAIGKFFKEFGEAAAKGDGAVKASLLVAGAGYWKRKQIIKGFLVTLLEIGLILYTVLIGVPYISQLNTLGLTACEAAYRYGGEWHAELLGYLKSNLNFLREFLQTRLPEVKLIEPEGTYLVWLDFGSLGLTEEQREELLTKKAGIWLDSGAIFGAAGEGFERINIACPRSILKDALERIERAVRQ